jgi:hypothetical protein
MSDSTLFMNSAAFERLVNRPPHSHAYYEAKFQARLKKIAPAGVGKNCHSSLLGVATLGIQAGHSADELVEVIKAAIPPGKREVSRKEIHDAVNRAMQDTVPAGSNPFVQPTTRVPSRVKLSKTEVAETKKHVLSYSSGPVKLDCEEFRNAHGFKIKPQPITPLYPEAFTMIQLIPALFGQNDLLYVGSEKMENGGIDNIRTAEEWTIFFKEQQHAVLERIGNEGWSSSEPSAFLMDLGKRFSHIVPNPVTGCFGKKTDGGLSLRCDGSICGFNFTIIDFDDFTLGEQGEILHCLCEAMDLRICAVVHTGGKGFHALIKINGVDSLDAWNKKVRDGLFPTFEALGVDPACANPSRGFRLPGVYRWETSAWQKLIFVSRDGVKI